jgi:CubicO group peptidase (beta-lactamase class C family)
VELESYGEITSVVVSRGGEIVTEIYREGDESTLRSTRSCTKTVLSMLVGIAIERDRFPGVDASIETLLPDRAASFYPDRRKGEITVEQLLTMSSCLECDDWNPYSAGNEERMYPREDWVQFALDLPIRGSSGFSYCTAGVVLLGVALERALGEPLPEFARHELFDPIAVGAFDWPTTPLGETSTAGGLLLTSRSLLALGRLYLRGGDGVVPAAWVSNSLRPHAQIDERTTYGYLWWLREFAGHPSYYMSGMGGNRVHVVPDLDLVAVITTTNFRRRDAQELSDRLLVEEILRRNVDLPAARSSSLGQAANERKEQR